MGRGEMGRHRATVMNAIDPPVTIGQITDHHGTTATSVTIGNHHDTRGTDRNSSRQNRDYADRQYQSRYSSDSYRH